MTNDARDTDPAPDAAGALAVALADDLANFDQYQQGFAAKLAGYVLHGTNSAALQTITMFDASDMSHEMLVERSYRHPFMPPILVSEVWHDFAAFAAAGSGPANPRSAL